MMSFYCPSPSSFFRHSFPVHTSISSPLPPPTGVHTHTNSPGLSISADDAWRRQRAARLVALVAAFMYAHVHVHQTRAMDAAAWKAWWGWCEQIRERVCAPQTGYFVPPLPSLFPPFVATRATMRYSYTHRYHYDNITRLLLYSSSN